MDFYLKGLNTNRNNFFSNIERQDSYTKIKRKNKEHKNSTNSSKTNNEKALGYCELYEKKLFEVIEKSLIERIVKVGKIKKNYGLKIEGIVKMGVSKNNNQVIREIYKNMNSDIEFISSQIENRRKTCIEKLKNEYGIF